MRIEKVCNVPFKMLAGVAPSHAIAVTSFILIGSESFIALLKRYKLLVVMSSFPSTTSPPHYP
jgi:hypothetical protein